MYAHAQGLTSRSRIGGCVGTGLAFLVGVACPRGVRKTMAAAKEEGSILQTFWGLASLNDQEREDSARELLTSLSKKQVGYNKRKRRQCRTQREIESCHNFCTRVM